MTSNSSQKFLAVLMNPIFVFPSPANKTKLCLKVISRKQKLQKKQLILKKKQIGLLSTKISTEYYSEIKASNLE